MSVLIGYVPFHDARKWEREGVRTRDGHVCLQLVRSFGKERLLVLDRPTCLAEFTRLRGRWSVPGKAIQSKGTSRVTLWRDDIVVLDSLLPELGFRNFSFHLWLMRAYASARYVARVKEICTARNGTTLLLWLCHPFAVGLLESWNVDRVVLDAFDNFAIHPELAPRVHRAVRRAYETLCARADRIVVNSLAMQEYLWRLCRRDTLLVPNGVDAALFAGARPMTLPALERPLVGYAGKLGQRIDVDLVQVLADALPNGTIVLAGQLLNEPWVRAALEHPRVRHLGDLHYCELPGFLAACDVCIVPHRVGLGENSGDPTKIYEYLAAGRPVVTTRIGGVERFEGRVTIAKNHASFIEATLAACRGEKVPLGAVLPDESWEARTAVILQYFGLAQ